MHRRLAALYCVIALVMVNFSIASKERLLSEGRVIYLELAPIDPRSLMQGDYMALRYKLAAEASPSLRQDGPSSGRVVIALDERSIGHFKRVHQGGSVASDEALLNYRVRDGMVQFGTNAFFFQERTGDRYAKARFGEFRVSSNGEMLLTGLRGESLEPLTAPTSRGR
ncbi:MAG: hypothetical protein C5B46_08145 [Proteobacteria bacterium]|nr:MAG: hypothetical protein C5B46_08145 [Pseudomonadota bacterium]